MNPQPAPSSPSNRVARVAFVLILATQLVVPVIQLPKPRLAHFGWHMFSDLPPFPTYWIVLADGSQQLIDVHEHIGVRRLDADYHSVLPDYLRRTYPQAVAVRWQRPGSNAVEERRWQP